MLLTVFWENENEKVSFRRHRRGKEDATNLELKNLSLSIDGDGFRKISGCDGGGAEGRKREERKWVRTRRGEGGSRDC